MTYALPDYECVYSLSPTLSLSPIFSHSLTLSLSLSQTGALISDLTITHARQEDSGNYICRSSDREIDSLKVTVLVGRSLIEELIV